MLQESALDSLPASQDDLEFPEEEASSGETADGSRGTKRTASTADQERLMQNAAAQKRYRIRQKNEKEQAKEKHAALERRMKSIEDLCSVMQSQIAMLEAAQRVQMKVQENSPGTTGAESPPTEAKAVHCHALAPPFPQPMVNKRCESSLTGTVELALQGQLPLEQMIMARIRAMLGIVNSGEQPNGKIEQLLRIELRSFWEEKRRFEQRLEGEGFAGSGFGLDDAKSLLLVNAMDRAPQGQVDIDQELYGQLMRCRDKAQYSSEILDRVVAVRDSYGNNATPSPMSLYPRPSFLLTGCSIVDFVAAASIHTIRLDREAINAEIIALMQNSHSGISSTAEETTTGSDERAVVVAERASTASREPWEWQERTRNAYRIVQATNRLSTSLKAERDAVRTFLSTLYIETLPPVVSAHIVLAILEAKHRKAPHQHQVWFPKFMVTLRTVATHMSKFLADRHAARATGR